MHQLNHAVRFAADESGQTMAEYAIVLAVITVTVVVTLGLSAARSAAC